MFLGNLLHHLRETVDVMGAKNQVQVRELLQQLLALLLGDAAAHTEDQVRFAFLHRLEASQMTISFTYSFISYSTGVEQDQISLLRFFDLAITDFIEQADNPLRVDHVHLATKSFQVKSFIVHRRISISFIFVLTNR